MSELEDRAKGCLAGAAVGDAIGGATEGYSPQQIQERHSGLVTGIVEPFNADWRNARPISPYHKGDGHITDDTLMTHAIVRVYDQKGDHLGAFDMEKYLVPEMMGTKTWIPEFENEAIILQRVFLAEKWLALRLFYGHVDPREAGTGNVVNCGAAMYMAPVGIVNAANPERAYDEAIDMAGAHQSSFGREAAGVFAAGVAAAFLPGATAASVVQICVELAKDGTRAAIEAVLEGIVDMGDWADSLEAMRDVIRPFDYVADDYRNKGLAAGRPSRLHSIEELPVALGFLALTGGNYSETVLAAANYGRDADSIAVMGGAIAGALGGLGSVPQSWRDDVSTNSKLDIESPAIGLAELAVQISTRDRAKQQATAIAFDQLL